MSATLLLLCLAAAPKPAGAPIAEVWPYQAKLQPDGAMEFSYDLTAVKAQGGTADAIAASGEEKVKEFLKGLPTQTRVVVKPGAGFALSVGRGAEPGALVNSLAAIGDGALGTIDPLARPGSHLRAALHPLEPKPLLSTEAVLWRTRRLLEGAIAAITLDSERLHAALWSKVAERALARLKTVNGDAKEGAVALAGRLFASAACLDSAKLPAAAKAVPQVAAAAEQELVLARADPQTAVAPGLYGWSRELACARVRTRILSTPFPQSRAGAAAALTLLGMFQADPKLNAAWEAVKVRRDALEIGPAKEPLLDYRERTGGKYDEALENMAGFIDALGETLPSVPPPLAAAHTPFSAFLSELDGPARVSALDELLAAAQDGRLVFPTQPDAPLTPQLEAALAHLVVEPKSLQLDAAWRERRQSTFAALVGGHRESRDEGSDLADAPDEKTDLRVRLMVPPTLEVEPAPATYLAAADALERLAATVAKLNLGGLQAVAPEGGRSAESIASEAKRAAAALRGFARLSTGDEKSASDKDLAEARRLAAGWRADPAFGKDVREVRAFPIEQGAERLHAAIAGVARRELVVGFGSEPSATLAVPGAFDVVPGEQRYLVPVLVTRSALAKASAPPLERAAFRALCETAKRQANDIEAALVEALKAR